MLAIYFLLSLIFVPQVSAQVLSSEIPDYLVDQSYSDLSHRALKRVCNASLAVPATIPCNPNSLISLPEKSFFFVNVYGSDQIEKVRSIDNLFRNDKAIDAVETLLREEDPINAQASASLNYAKNNFAISIVPIRASIFSFTRNPVNPQAATFAKKDREVKVQYNFESDRLENIAFGINGRFLSREYVMDEYTLLDALFDIRSVLPKRDYRALYLEPAITYYFDSEWLPRFSFFSENTVIDAQYDEGPYSDRPYLNFGFGINPPLPLGLLELLVNYSRSMNSTFSRSDTLRVGSRYTLGLLNVSFGMDRYDRSLSLFTTLWALRFGVLYEDRKYENILGEERKDESLLVEFSYIF